VARLRPAKVRSGMRRRWFERGLGRLRPEPCSGLVTLGSDYGNWTIPEIVEPSWICYCIGAGGDISFERELIRRYGVIARSFEPDEEYIERAEVDPEHASRFSKHRVAIATADGPLRMQRTHIPGSRSLSPAGLYDSEDYVDVPGRTIRSLMDELGDERIELLKIDVEGGEYELMPTLDLRALGVRVLCIQLHHTGSVRQAQALVDHVRGEGFRLVVSEPVVRLTFVRDG
jgi:FkbM family methyltransferase